MMGRYWNVVSRDDWVMTLEAPDKFYSARVKRDGCIQFARHFNTPNDADHDPEATDDLHICDLEEEIARLQALKVAIEGFRDNEQVQE